MSKPGDDKEKPSVETDPRFPSGPWTGFWVQRGWGKQRMSLSLAFAEGRVRGQGRDVIGEFDFAGSYELETGRTRMVKHYARGHWVEYDGANQGDGLWLWGLWTVETERGGFHLWPEGEDDPTQKRTGAQKEMPAPARLRKGELVGAGVLDSPGPLDD